MRNGKKYCRGVAAVVVVLSLLTVVGDALAIGQSAVVTLAFPVGARPTAMGEAFTGLANDANAIYYNPAGLGQSPLTLSWKLYMGDSAFTAVAARSAATFGARDYVWAGSNFGLTRFNGKIWETGEVYLPEDNESVRSIALRYLNDNDKTLVDNAIWEIRKANGIGMARYEQLVLLLESRAELFKNDSTPLDPALYARSLILLPSDEQTYLHLMDLLPQSIPEKDRSDLANSIVSVWDMDDKGISSLTELKIPFTIAVRDTVTAITIDKSERLWVGMVSGLWRYSNGKWQFFSTEDGLPSNRITSISYAPNGDVAAGTDKGVALLRSSESKWLSFSAENGLPDSYVTSIAFDNTNQLYVGTPRGLARISHGIVTTPVKSPSSTDNTDNTEEIDTVQETSSPETPSPETPDAELSAADTASIDTLTTDVASDDTSSTDTLSTDDESDDTIIVSTDISGDETSTEEISEETTSTEETTTTADAPAAAEPQIRDGFTVTVFDSSSGLLSLYVSALFVDSKNQVWIGGENGITIYSGARNWKRYRFPGSIIYSFAEQSNGTMWIGTNKGVITHKEGKPTADATGKIVTVPEWKTYHSKNALKNDEIRAMTACGKDMWLATDNSMHQYAHAEMQVLLFYEQLLPTFRMGDLWHGFPAIIIPTEDWGTLGFSLNYINMGDNERFDEFDKYVGRSRSWEGVFGISYGLPIKEDLSLGINAKYVVSVLDPSIGGWGQTFAIDAGVLKRNFMIPNLDIGFMLQNMGPNIYYMTPEEADPIPFSLRLGFAYKPVRTPFHELTLVLDAYREVVKNYIDKAPDPFWVAIWTGMLANDETSFKEEIQEINVSLGAEYLYADFMALRAGFLGDYLGERFELSVGLGIKYANMNFDFSYIYAPPGFMGGLLRGVSGNKDKEGASGARDGQWRISFLFGL